jgi:hypothetical protein
MELAFILIFLLLVLAGWMIGRAERDRLSAQQEAEAASARLKQVEIDELAREEWRRAEAELRRLVADQTRADPAAVVSALTAKAAQEAENRRLRQRIENLDAQLSALTEVKELAARQGGERAAAEVLSAMTFKRALEAAAGAAIPAGREQDEARRLAEAAAAVREAATKPGDPLQLAAENRDLRAQSAWLRNQLEARGGRDFPPCWAEPGSGRPQYLLTVELREGGIKVDPAWPPERAADAARLPGLAGLANGEVQAVGSFRSRAAALDADSKAKGCRHYVRLVNRVGNLAAFNRLRYAVEEFFYKFEVR